jgi:GNAT superfamily N-acetyltransferase
VSEPAVRAATAADRPEILALMRSTLGWDDDARFDALFAWKHDENPFGPSPAWVATDGERIVGFRTFMRWEFEQGGAILRAVRAVDTATHPDYQGRGIFTKLTMAGIEELRSEGVDLVFNTPNDQSRPGYLKMGWQVVGRLALTVRPHSLRRVARLRRARVPAELWSVRSDVAEPAAARLADDSVVGMVTAPVDAAAVTTRRTPAFLRWRYGFAPLDYRALRDEHAGGVAFFRLRQRGPAIEATVDDVLTSSRPQRRALVGAIAGFDQVDYVAALASSLGRDGSFSMQRFGPMLTARLVAADTIPPLAQWQLCLGDIELF